jgi:methylmalonyl-CoA/ethylmalonyl-CoA epimerase
LENIIQDLRFKTRKKEESLTKVKPVGITHIGIAVTDLEKAISDYSTLFDFDEIERMEVEGEGVKVAMLRTGVSEFELLSPTNDESAIAKFIRERGEGIHHVAIRVPDVPDAMEKAKAIGMRVLDNKPRSGARGAKAAFVHPKSFHGVLLEFYDR